MDGKDGRPRTREERYEDLAFSRITRDSKTETQLLGILIETNFAIERRLAAIEVLIRKATRTKTKEVGW